MANYLKVFKTLHCLNVAHTRNATFSAARCSRSYSRWLHRRPKSVIFPECEDTVSEVEVKRRVELDYRADIPLHADSSEIQTKHIINEKWKSTKLKSPKVKQVSNQPPESLNERKHNVGHIHSPTHSRSKQAVSPASLSDDEVTGSDEEADAPAYVKLKDRDPKLSNIMLTIKSTKKKRSREMVVLEGRRLIQDSVNAGVVPLMIFFSRINDIKLMNLPASGVEIYKVPYKAISLWSELTTCPGIMGIIKLPAAHEIKSPPGSLPLIIVCDNIRDPGNLGTILRTAAGVGCQKVILTKGCVDVWDSKVLRSATGAHFRVPIHSSMNWDSVDELIGENSSVFLADNKLGGSPPAQDREENAVDLESNERDEATGLPSAVKPIPYYSVDFMKPSSIVLVIGGETEGLSGNALRLAHKRQGRRLIVPLSNRVESLNSGTALAVIAFEVKRQFSQSG